MEVTAEIKKYKTNTQEKNNNKSKVVTLKRQK